jgi:hypothetical protein
MAETVCWADRRLWQRRSDSGESDWRLKIVGETNAARGSRYEDGEKNPETREGSGSDTRCEKRRDEDEQGDGWASEQQERQALPQA